MDQSMLETSNEVKTITPAWKSNWITTFNSTWGKKTTPVKAQATCNYCGKICDEVSDLEENEGFCDDCEDGEDLRERHAYVESLEVKTYAYGEKLKLAKAHVKVDRMSAGSMVFYRIAGQKPLFEKFMRAMSKAESDHVWVEEFHNGKKKELTFVIK